jgi:ribosomal protein L10
VRGDAALAAKAIANFRKEYELLSFKGGVMGGDGSDRRPDRDIAKLRRARCSTAAWWASWPRRSPAWSTA